MTSGPKDFYYSSRLLRLPWLTFLVTAVTLGVNLWQLAHPSLLDTLQRTPAIRHGEWYRLFTALVVQDGRAFGIIENVPFLLVLGLIAEQVVGRGKWLLAYVGVGLVAEAVALWWQPEGGGNSVADCGLLAVILIAMLRADRRLPVFAPFFAVLWIGVMLSTAWWPLAIAGLIVGFPVQRTAVASPGWRKAGSVLAFVFALAVAVFLCTHRNIHGAAMLVGILLALVMSLVPLRLPTPRSDRASGPAPAEKAPSGTAP